MSDPPIPPRRTQARTIAAQVQAGAGVARLAALQDVLVDDRLTVWRGGAKLFEGPIRTGRRFELQVRVPFTEASSISPTTPGRTRRGRRWT